MFYHNLGFIFIVWSIGIIGYNIVQTKAIAEVCECGYITKNLKLMREL